jgi:hypothetical protein
VVPFLFRSALSAGVNAFHARSDSLILQKTRAKSLSAVFRFWHAACLLACGTSEDVSVQLKGSRMNQAGRRAKIGGADSVRITDDPTPPLRDRESRSRKLAEGEVA